MFEVREAAVGLQDSVHLQHGELPSAVRQQRSPQRGGQSDGLLHAGIAVTLLPAPALGVGGAREPGVGGGHAGRRAHSVYAVRVSWRVCYSEARVRRRFGESCLCLCVCRIRLSEGFHFAASGEGIVNMAIELPMRVKEDGRLGYLWELWALPGCNGRMLLVCVQGMSGVDADRESHSCIVQYILFPPHSASMKDR